MEKPEYEANFSGQGHGFSALESAMTAREQSGRQKTGEQFVVYWGVRRGEKAFQTRERPLWR